MTSNLYNVRRLSNDLYRVVKFDEHYNPLKTYEINGTSCSCPQGANRKQFCRHLEIRDIFLFIGRIDTGWFYDYDNAWWYPPINQNIAYGDIVVMGLDDPAALHEVIEKFVRRA